MCESIIMLIIRPSFKDYCVERSLCSFDEMAVGPSTFAGKKGEQEGPYHVSITNPVFMDTYDIYYLYQFPPSFWSAAFRYRYNHALHDAKNHLTSKGEGAPEIQNVTLGHQGGQTITFKNRNMFINHLIDKIERAVDVDHFRKSTGSGESQKYKDEGMGHKEAGRDLGGHIGASLADPKKKMVPGKRNGKPVEEELFVSRGFMGVNYAVASETIAGWMVNSSAGWLKDLSKYEHEFAKVSSSGGAGGPKTVAAFKGGTLKNIQTHMKSIGAKPFEIAKDRVFWPDVIIQNKKGESTESHQFTGNANTAKIGEPLPALFPGKAIDSRDVKAYEADQELAQKITNIEDDDLKKINSDLESQIKNLEQEIEEKDVNDQWDSEDVENSKERNAKMDQLFHLKSLNDFKQWMKQSNPNMIFTPEVIRSVAGSYQEFLKNKIKDRMRNAKSYGPYEWNLHKYNRERHSHDPLNTGVANPLFLGKPKYKGLRDKTRLKDFGGFFPNRQSKDMLHSPTGHWEDNFKSHFGHGMDDVTGETSIPSHLNAEDFNQLEKSLNDYYKKISEKLANDPDVLSFLGGTKSELMRDLLDITNIKNSIVSKLPDIKIPRNGYINDERVPASLQAAHNEMKKSNDEFNRLQREVSSGSRSESAIADGIDRTISKLPSGSPIHAAITSLRPLLIMNAEKFIRRTTGEAAFANFMDAKKKSGVEKHQAALDLRAFISNKAKMYADSISQLDFGEGTRRTRIGIPKAGSLDATGTEGGSSFGSMVSADAHQDRLDQRMLDDMLDNPDMLEDFENSLFAGNTNVKKSTQRRHRPASDATSGTIGHSLEVMYKLIDDAHQQADQVTNQLGEKIKKADPSEEATPSNSEIDMVTKITGAAAYFQLFKALQQRKASKNGVTLTDKEINKAAKEKTIEYLQKHGVIKGNFVEPEEPSSPQAIAQSFKTRMDDDGVLDQDEQQAANIISSWEDKGYNAEKISQELNNMETLAKAGGHNIGPGMRRVTDLILVTYGRPTVYGTLNQPTAMAASATGEMLPDEDIPTHKTDKALRIAKKIQLRLQKNRQQMPQQIQQQQKMPPKPVAPLPLPQPVRPTGKSTGLAGFRRPPQ